MWSAKRALLLEMDRWSVADLVLSLQLQLPPNLWERIREWVVQQGEALVIQGSGHFTPPCTSTSRAHWLTDLSGKLQPSSYLARIAAGKRA